MNSTRSVSRFLVLGILTAAVAQSLTVAAGEPSSQNSTLRHLSRLQWKLGVIARDEQHDPVKAAHDFYRAAESAQQAGDEDLARDFLLAAQYSSNQVDFTLVHDDQINEAKFGPSASSSGER